MAFNLKKKAISPAPSPIQPSPTANNMPVPPQQDPAVMFVYQLLQDQYPSPQAMVDKLGLAEIKKMAPELNTQNLTNIKDTAKQLEQAKQQMQTALPDAQLVTPTTTSNSKDRTIVSSLDKKGNKMVKPFNLKKAQPVAPMQGSSDDLNDAPELIGDQLQEQQSLNTPVFKSVVEFKTWLDQRSQNPQEAYNLFTQLNADSVKEAVEAYYTEADEDQKDNILMEIYHSPQFPAQLKDDTVDVPATKRQFGEINDILKKIAKDSVKKEVVKKFNLTKNAQHKALDNVIMWGPQPTPRVDPFLRQPVSDWHIVERNKGFGLVVDDIWNIDYETIWRQNIMDKYSRPYRTADGEWVGGYIQKRFEVDKNIPETNNMQLKPGQLRKPILPEYGTTESRLQAARSKNEIEGADDKSKPFNWKEAKKKT